MNSGRKIPLGRNRPEDKCAALHNAVVYRNNKALKELLNEDCCSVDAENDNGETPLLVAVRKDNWHFVEMLLFAGADINRQNRDGDTALHITLMHGYPWTISVVEPESGAMKAVEKILWWIPVLSVEYKLPCYLVLRGANIDCPNNKGETPLDIASSTRSFTRQALMSIICERGNARSGKCQVCLEAIANMRFEPCGHCLYCDDCGSRMPRCLSCKNMISNRVPNAAGSETLNEMTPSALQEDTDKELKAGPEIYEMRRNPRGQCIILNNCHFHKPSDTRKGSYLDVERMENLFRPLHFTVTVRWDLSAKEMVEVLSSAAKKKDHGNADCLVVILMSHGDSGIIYGTDWKPVNLGKEVYPLFNNANCPALKGKPKLFFIQSCRGKKRNFGVDHEPDPIAVDVGSPELIPEWSDVFYAYATIPDYVAIREYEDGSWFFSDVEEVFRYYAATTDLEGLMRKVAAKLMQRSGDALMQTPGTETYGWRKKLYFNPGHYV